MEQRRQEEPEDWKSLRRGWCWGDAGFREKLLGLLDGAAGEHHYGEEVRESAEAKGERLVAAGLARTGWREADLELRRKGDGVKVALAEKLRRETTLGWRWISERLHMGHWRAAANAVLMKRK